MAEGATPLWRWAPDAGALADAATAATAGGAGGKVEAREDAGGGKGRGLFWAGLAALPAGALAFRERPLAAAQHVSNRAAAPCCPGCHRFVGGGERFLSACLGRGGEGTGDSLTATPPAAVGGSGSAPGGSFRVPRWKEAMAAGGWAPPAAGLRCRGGCGAEYCGVACEEAAWRGAHGLLCPGAGPAPAWDEALEAARAEEEGTAGPPQKRARPESSNAENGLGRQFWSAAFLAHAAATNDVFALAGLCVADVLSRARRRLAERPAEPAPGAAAADAALRWAWTPYGLGWKALWWECVPCPPESAEGGNGGEREFRAALRGLAGDSALLLRRALFDARFPALFNDEVLGSLVGMFELNNLDMVVSNPLARYFRYMESLREGVTGKEEAGGLAEGDLAAAAALEALIEDADTDCHCSGTAFFRAQSLMNHSCDPNCAARKGDADADDSAMLYALRPIQPGEELTISYIEERDEDGQLRPVEERRRLLRDYGFECGCPLCVKEAEAKIPVPGPTPGAP